MSKDHEDSFPLSRRTLLKGVAAGGLAAALTPLADVLG